MTLSFALRRLRTPALAAGFALALLVAVPGSAQAAGGSYTYITAAGQGFRVDEPQSDTCLPLVGGAIRFSNDTTDTAFLYGDSSCSGGWALVGVGATWDAPTGVQAFGVRLGSTALASKGARS
ncbi:hypothetical protein GCM10010260_45390 [Streptomyces filipinensis]|uniref:Peptidase inhibitor family I36 n=1 Tax=Streptomyces filipinensis TaxID=66887 RepID=A0A918MD16_9ACTN|nr:hypothetical protein [Streptomyces filipinensis]GGV03535.1 hypothetical protein GCM10010260_45390 [Streptomyces filipinensis]